MVDISQDRPHIEHQYIADRININGEETPEALFERAKRQVAEKLYVDARKLLTTALGQGLKNADLFYYLALTTLSGRKTSQLDSRADEVFHEVEQYLYRATRLDPRCDHAYALWAEVKRDYFQDETEPPPTSDQLRAKVKSLDPQHAEEIRPFSQDRADMVWQQILTAARDSRVGRRYSVGKYFIVDPTPPRHVVPIVLTIATALSGYLGYQADHYLHGTGRDVLVPVFLILSLTTFILALVVFAVQRTAYAQQLRRARPKPSDQQMDDWLAFDRILITDHALRSLGRPLSSLLSEPHVVIGPAANAKHATGADGITRFSRYKVVILLLARRRLSIYSCEWDFLRARATQLETFDCRYTDVTGLSTKEMNSRGLPLKLISNEGKLQKADQTRQFEMIIAGTDRIAVIFDVHIARETGKLAASGALAAERLIRRQLNFNL